MVVQVTNHTDRLASVGMKGHLVYIERSRAAGGLNVFHLWDGRQVLGRVETPQAAVDLALAALSKWGNDGMEASDG